jgi:hypothetical protein
MEQNPLAKYELRRAGGSARNTEGMFTNINGNAARDARRAAKRDARPMTYAEMQEQGMARPAPPDNLNLMFTGPSDYANLGDTQIDADTGPYGGGGSDYVPPPGPSNLPAPTSAPSYFPSGGSGSGAGSGLPGFPAFDTGVYDRLRSAALANLRAQFAGQKEDLEDELARRGLSASSIGAGRLGDLLGQQARAVSSLEADLLAREDDRQRALMDLYIRMAPILAAGKK